MPEPAKRTRRGVRTPLLLFAVAVLLAAFGAGMYVEAAGLFPSGLVRSAYKTLAVNLNFMGFGNGTDAAVGGKCVPVAAGRIGELRKEFRMPALKCPAAPFASADAAESRIEFLASDTLADPVLVKGDAGTFLEHCPAPSGCLAVEYSRSGSVSRAWPFRPEEIARANIAPESDYPYEHPIGWSPLDAYAFSVALYPNGDLLVVLQLYHSHPYGGGIARVAPDGQPRWYRKDYSHHVGHIVDENLALVPALRRDRSQIEYQIPVEGGSRKIELRCQGQILEDVVNFVGGGGELLDQIPVLDAIAESRYGAALWPRPHACDPTHLNFVHVLGADAGGADDIAPGDLVVSLRNLNAFAILDKNDHRLKKLVRGSFTRQHGVRHLDNARFIMYDNLGSDGVNGPSRLLIVDLATNEETAVFPNDDTPAHLRRWFTPYSGQFDISPDGRRALIADVHDGRAFEIRLADGKVLNVFRHLHDLSKLPDFPHALTERAWFFSLHAIYYANRWTAAAERRP